MKYVRKRQVELQNRLLYFVSCAGDVSYIRVRTTLSHHFSLIRVQLLLTWAN